MTGLNLRQIALGFAGASVVVMGVAGATWASSHGNAMTFDLVYAQIGDWEIKGGSETGDTCAAETDNGAVSLLVTYTEYTGDWHMGVPYYDEDNPTASVGVGEEGFLNDALDMSSDFINGWALADGETSLNILESLSAGDYLNLELDRGVQSWQISPGDRDKVLRVIQECARNSGKKQASSKPQKVKKSSAAASYELINIANAPGARERRYGKARGWTVYDGKIDGRTRYCVGEKDYGGTSLRLGFDGGQWQVAVPYPASPDYYGSFDVDGRSEGMSGTSDGEWSFGWIGMPELDAIRNGNLLILDIGKASFDFDLKGTAAVITKIEECMGR
jgi:hypothetical protein